jgi:tetratricopeptide (TPR) repeat protein
VQAANPENGMVYVELSLAQSEAGLGKEALKNSEQAIAKLGNAHDLAVFSKARALQADNQLDKARETYLEALQDHQAGQDWPELWFAMGQLRMQEKNPDEAAGMYQKAVALWDKQGGSIDLVADAYEALGKAFDAQGKKHKKEAQDAFQKAEDLRKGNKA